MTKNTKKTPKEKMELVKADGNTAGIFRLFEDNTAPIDSGMRVKSRSPLLKPDKFPVGKRLTGIIKGLIPCVVGKGERGRDKMGFLVEIVPALDSIGVALPGVATIANALEIKSSGEGKETVFSTPFINHRVAIERLQEKIPSKKGNAAWHFLVAISEKPVTS